MIVDVKCPRCGKDGRIDVPDIKADKAAFTKCPECGLVYGMPYDPSPIVGVCCGEVVNL